MPSDPVSGLNQKLVSSITGVKFMNIIGWIVFAVIIIVLVWFGALWWKNKKLFRKKITAFEIIGINFEPSIRDIAKTVKLGSGGFEILYLRKMKTWKLGYGGRVGRDTYYFFIMPDGYWYNGMLSANMHLIDKYGGLVPIVTTNPSMRSQYTSLEKQIEQLHQNKEKFWDKYGHIIIYAGLIMLSGFFLWLNYREYATAMSNQGAMVDGFSKLVDKLNTLTTNIQGGGTANSGLVPSG